MVKIISDSTCDLSPELVNRYDIDICRFIFFLVRRNIRMAKI